MISSGHCQQIITNTTIGLCFHTDITCIWYFSHNHHSLSGEAHWSGLNKDEKRWHFSHCLSHSKNDVRPAAPGWGSGLVLGSHDWKYRLTAPGDKNQISVHFDPHPDNHIATLPALMNRLQGPGKAPIIGVRLIIHKWWSQDKHKEFNQPMERTKIRANSWGANNY